MHARSLITAVALAVMASSALAEPVTSHIVNGEGMAPHRKNVEHSQPDVIANQKPAPMPRIILPAQASLPTQLLTQPNPVPAVEPRARSYTNPGFKMPPPASVQSTHDLSDRPISLAPPAPELK